MSNDQIQHFCYYFFGLALRCLEEEMGRNPEFGKSDSNLFHHPGTSGVCPFRLSAPKLRVRSFVNFIWYAETLKNEF